MRSTLWVHKNLKVTHKVLRRQWPLNLPSPRPPETQLSSALTRVLPHQPSSWNRSLLS